MTVTDEATSHEGDAGPEAEPAERRSRIGTIFAISATAVIVVGAAIAWATWAALTQATLAGVSVVYDSQPVVCTGTTVEDTPIDVYGAYRRPMIVLAPGMVCELRIQVVNDGWADANVDAITLMGLWDDNASGLVPTMINPNGAQRVDDEQGARFDMGTFPVAAGTVQTFSAVLEYNGDSSITQCAAQGWNIPAATVSALGATRTVQPPERDVIWVRMGELEGCEAPQQ